MPESQRSLRGHALLPGQSSRYPRLGSTESTPLREKVVHSKFFIGAMNWLLIEFDPVSRSAFGYCDLGVGGAELGAFSMDELESVRLGTYIVVERDTEWVPKRFDEAAPPVAWLYTLSEREQADWRRANA